MLPGRLVASTCLALAFAGCVRSRATSHTSAFAPDDPQARPPSAGPVAPPRLPTARSAVLPNGLRVTVAPAPGDVQMTLAVLRGGYAEEGALPGVAAATISLLLHRFQDTVAWPPDGQEFGPFSTTSWVTFRSAYIQQTVKPALMGVFLWGLARTLRDFTPRRRDLAALRGELTRHLDGSGSAEFPRPEDILRGQFSGSPPAADVVSARLGALTPAAVAAWHRPRYVPGAMTLLVQGRVTFDEVMAYAERLFGAWQGPPPPPPAASPFGPLDAPPRVSLVPALGRPRATVLSCLTLNVRTPEERAAAEAFNNAYCGGLQGRVLRVLRVDRGDAYFANSEAVADGTTFGVFCKAEVEPGRVADTIAAMRNVAAAMAERGLAPDELQRAQRTLLTGWNAQFESPEGLRNSILVAGLEGLDPAREPPAAVGALHALRVEALNRYLAREVHADRMHTFVWADPSELPPGSVR